MNGWIDRDIVADWLVNIFDPATQEKAGEKKHALYMDGHSSYNTLHFLQEAKKHNITIFSYSSHCTHNLQGLDVACFARMKELFAQELEQFYELHMGGINKEEFGKVIRQAYLKAFTPETVCSAFTKTRIHLYNLNVISDAQMKPSAAVSVKGFFPLPQATPVHAIYETIYTTCSPSMFLAASHADLPSLTLMMTPC